VSQLSVPHPIQETYPHRAIVQERIRIGLPSAVMAGDVPDASDNPAAKLLTRDEARRIAANKQKLSPTSKDHPVMDG
jgi:hypothetical protein